MNGSINWNFPTTGGGKKTGFNESGIQFFNDDTLLSLAREICQNSLDAKLDNNDDPVVVEFSSFYLEKDKIMGYDVLYDIFCREIEFAKKYYVNDKNPITFYSEAKRLLDDEKLLCLRISDFNTTGLVGSNREFDSKWDRLVKSEGFSDNPATSGGSFGIGKNAAFACSKLHTVFYSTLDCENLVANQGVAKLSSCELEDGNMTQGTGYFGNIVESGNFVNLDRIQEQLFIDPEFSSREISGTDIYILGFDDRNSSRDSDGLNEIWATDIAASIIDNYFVSILDNKLIVRINGIELNKETVYEIFTGINERNPELFNQYTVDYFDVLVTDKYETKFKSFSIFEPDDVVLHIAFDPNFKNRIGIIKGTGMKIFDKDHLPQNYRYTGVLKLVGKKVNAFFRQMENPKHDGWSPSRLPNEKEARDEYNRLFKYVKDAIREFRENSMPESMDAEGVGEFLPDDFDDGTSDDNIENVKNEDLTEVKPSKNVVSKKQKSHTINAIDLVKSRCLYNHGKYEFIFVSSKDIDDAIISITIAGEINNYKPVITSATSQKKLFTGSSLSFNDNIINIGKVNKGEQRKIQFTLNDAEDWALEVKLYEN